MNKNKNDILEKLQEDVVIPDMVQNRADAVLAGIRSQTPKDTVQQKNEQRRKIPRKRMWIVIAAAIVTLGAASVGAAAYMKWSKGLSEGLRASEEQKKTLEDNHMVTPIEQAATDNGVTVTVTQSIVDSYYAYISLKVEGFEVAEGEQPDFGKLEVLIDGKSGFSENMQDSFAATGRFYDGLTAGDDGSLVNVDGSELTFDESGGHVRSYIMKDGSMEYILILDSHGNRESFINKTIQISLENLGTLAQADYIPGMEGSWSFDWTLEGSADKKEFSVNVPWEDGEATLLKAEISPISIYAEYEYPRQIETESYIDQETYITYADPPTLTGVKMKDGSLHPFLCYEPGLQGYLTEDSDVYTKSFSFDRILDVEQIEALLIVKSYPQDGSPITEEDFYVLPLE